MPETDRRRPQIEDRSKLLLPLVLTIVAWALILMLADFSIYFQRYTTRIDNSFEVPVQFKNHFQDLNGDGLSEKIQYRYNTNNQTPGVIYFDNQNLIINQWNFTGKWLDDQKIFFGDLDGNKFLETYTFTRNNDSLFMHIGELMKSEGEGIYVQNRFFSTVNINEDKNYDVRVVSAMTEDLDKDGIKELVFTCTSGFSLHPRQSFAYYVKQDSLVVSPRSSAHYSHLINYADFNGDGIRDITGATSASSNSTENEPYPDSLAWIMALDPVSMDYIFPPVGIDYGIGTNVQSSFIKLGDQTLLNTVVINKNAHSGISSYLHRIYNNKGEIIKEKQYPKEMFEVFPVPIIRRALTEKPLFIDPLGNLFHLDENLEFQTYQKNTKKLDYFNTIEQMCLDIDNDQKLECIVFSRKSVPDELIIFENNFKDIIRIPLPNSRLGKKYHASIVRKEDGNQIYFQTDKMAYEISYYNNPFYHFYYAAYLGIFVFLYLFFFLLQRLQAQIAYRRFNLEKELIRNQLTIAKNQLEPHFILNTLNNIGYMFMDKNTKDAQYYFGKYAGLIHRSLQYANQVETSLKEEIEFIKDYIELQKIRFNNELKFTLFIEDEINLEEYRVPHSLVYTFVENAIKHGLTRKEGEKELDLHIEKYDNFIRIRIADNGIGRKKSKELKTTDTGYGMLIINNIITSYNKLYGKQIEFRIQDLREGTMVIVRV
jgi:hypothetical protein